MAKKKSKSKSTKPSNANKVSQFENGEVDGFIAAALSQAPPPLVMKVCRLCETKDGPFLNIFDSDKVTTKKIEDLMPFGIAENDDLPHKICFRCSAKVEELHEFIQKCIKTQENLRSAMGKQGPLTMKSRTRVRWEQQLHKTKLSNDDICDVLIKRAMEGIPLNAPLNEIVEEKTQPTKQTKVDPPPVPKDFSESESDDDEDADVSLKQVKLSIAKTDEESPVTRTSRSSKTNELLDGLEVHSKKYKPVLRKPQNKPAEEKPPEPIQAKPSAPVEIVSKETEKPKPPPPEPVEKPPFNIMDHVSIIKVNGVGTLFQCKLCIRNFLKKEIVMNHGCAKNNAPPKETTSANAAPVEPPKPSTVKYIKMDKDPKKYLSSLIDKTVSKPTTEPPKPAEAPKPAEPEVKLKPKPKIGPASRIRPKPETELLKEPTPPPKPTAVSAPSLPPSISFPITPSLNSRYKLVPGPNNTFQLEPIDETKPVASKPEGNTKSITIKRRSETVNAKTRHKDDEKSSSPEVIDLDQANESQKAEPYPVGLFQPVPHHSSVYPTAHSPVPFTTPAMKKQSYTIVQTGNPSKLLISTKPQPTLEEPPKKKSKKKTETKDNEPFSGPVKDSAPAKDSGFFTFVSLDPLLQPSYVLPTDNIIQESQITTSTPGAKPPVDKEEKYPCNMCGETFSREKKLLAHIQSHYNQMDEEDEKRSGKPGPKRRTRKS